MPLVQYGPIGHNASPPVTIKDANVLEALLEAIKNQKPFTVNSASMGGDAFPGSQKVVNVWYYDTLHPSPIPIKHRQAKEGESLRFDVDILQITYGPITINSPNVYLSMVAALMSGGTFPVNDNALGGDPNFLVVKTCNVIYYSGGQIRQTSAEEDRHLVFLSPCNCKS